MPTTKTEKIGTDKPNGVETVTGKKVSVKKAALSVGDAHWEESFANPKTDVLLARMLEKVRADRDQGLNEELDIDAL